VTKSHSNLEPTSANSHTYGTLGLAVRPGSSFLIAHSVARAKWRLWRWQQRRVCKMVAVDDDLDRRLGRLGELADDGDILLLGCDLADADRQEDAERCFRKAADLGSEIAWFNLGNTLRKLGRDTDAVAAYEQAIAGGEADAYLNLAQICEERGDLAGAAIVYRQGFDAGDDGCGVSLAFLLRDQGERSEAMRFVGLSTQRGDRMAAAVQGCWQWIETQDPGLEQALRDGADVYPSARASLAALLLQAGRASEAQSVLEEGTRLGETESFLPLGNFYADQLGDAALTEEMYRRGIEAGDAHSHHNLAILLLERDELDEALNHLRFAVAAGDQLAARTLRELPEEA